MEYKGRKIGFKRTVGAVSDLARLAPDGNIERMGELFTGDLSTTVESGAQFLSVLNKWYEKSLAFEIDGYKPDPIPADWFLMLDENVYSDLINEAMKQFLDDDKVTVEAVEPKGSKKN
jgi:hypothetical protein